VSISQRLNQTRDSKSNMIQVISHIRLTRLFPVAQKSTFWK